MGGTLRIRPIVAKPESEHAMPRRVLINQGGKTFDLLEVPAPNEHHLQEIMKNEPQLIPSDDLGLNGDLLVVGRATALASGYIDLLCLSRSGDMVLIELKTGPHNPDVQECAHFVAFCLLPFASCLLPSRPRAGFNLTPASVTE